MNESNTNQRRRLVAGNWKMNGSRASNAELLSGITRRWTGAEGVDVAICPPFVYLQQASEVLATSGIVLGSQTVNEHPSGAYTGEVSASMLADFDCRYVIVGHNERRRLRGESNVQIADQFQAAQKAGMTPILCVGESDEEREAGEALKRIGQQLRVVIDWVGIEAFTQAVIAYEPIWAVGTGKVATPEQAEEVHRYIRGELGPLGERTQILYGGSVKPDNAAQLFALPDIDGALLGGASLKAEDFVAICEAAAQA